MASLEDLTRLLVSSLDDVARVASVLNTTLQQTLHPAFELSMDGVIWYLNRGAAEAIGVSPQQAVGTRLTTYVADALMTQRRLDALSQQSQAQSWPDAWQRPPDPPLPCRLTGFAIPHALGSERPRLILWSSRLENPAEAASARQEPISADSAFPGDHRIRGRDLDPLRQQLNRGVNPLCQQLGIAPATWCAWMRSPHKPIPNRTVELHLRLLATLPDLGRPLTQPAELIEALRAQRGIEMSYTDLALLMGVERRSGYAWSHGNPASDPVQALVETLLRMLLEKPRAAWDTYRQVVDTQARLEKAPLWTEKTWCSPEPPEAPPPEPVVQRRQRGRPPRAQPKPSVAKTEDGVNPTPAKKE